MKLLNKVKLNSFSVAIRNLFLFKPVDMRLDHIKESTSCSDSFCWRTDDKFTTLVNFSDLLRIFYDIKSKVCIRIYDANNKFIKKIIILNPSTTNSLLISKKFLGGYEGYGYFSIHHYSNKVKNKDNIIISNRCYLGFSYHESLPSFVHGNAISSHSPIQQNKRIRQNNIVQTSLISNQLYKVQNDCSFYEKVEIFLSNPTESVIKLEIENKIYTLNRGFSKIIEIKNKKEILIRSNCLFLRPVLFCFKNKIYLDVFHG
jgi:hypothetical protein